MQDVSHDIMIKIVVTYLMFFFYLFVAILSFEIKESRTLVFVSPAKSKQNLYLHVRRELSRELGIMRRQIKDFAAI